ncbi:hypothetical protein DAEQUDRAFT_221005 [Daedalea quercina L-15889]|uniref:Uncharacterized protein n=1 Tax=Daedalea quercina L-15889 TaxID=1314783 RepID=A0A165R6L6_9APHY|nr:hypothetical protein DAEQUDRAFT_221005 [Daedalea quercina L-15889]
MGSGAAARHKGCRPSGRIRCRHNPLHCCRRPSPSSCIPVMQDRRQPYAVLPPFTPSPFAGTPAALLRYVAPQACRRGRRIARLCARNHCTLPARAGLADPFSFQAFSSSPTMRTFVIPGSVPGGPIDSRPATSLRSACRRLPLQPLRQLQSPDLTPSRATYQLDLGATLTPSKSPDHRLASATLPMRARGNVNASTLGAIVVTPERLAHVCLPVVNGPLRRPCPNGGPSAQTIQKRLGTFRCLPRSTCRIRAAR